MTERENEIYQLIVRNPEISQQEIADNLNITRSSVAVHISNLMKKGKILGKKYIVQEDEFICVIGAVNVDIIATPFKELVEKDSNPGFVEYSFGGVGRNIAENLARLNHRVEMITVLGDDVYADSLIQHCEKLNIGIHHALKLKGAVTSTYLCMNDHRGEMQLAISAMDIYQQLTKEYILSKMDIINRAQVVVLDMNVSQEVIDTLAQHCKRPIFVDTVSTSKAVKVKSILNSVHTIKPNLIEAELLLDTKIMNDEQLSQAAITFLEKGVKQVFISLGENGVYYADEHHQGKLSNYKANIVNTTGCGDAFMAGVVHGYLMDQEARDSAKIALKASKICIESKEAVSENMTLENLLEEK